MLNKNKNNVPISLKVIVVTKAISMKTMVISRFLLLILPPIKLVLNPTMIKIFFENENKLYLQIYMLQSRD